MDFPLKLVPAKEAATKFSFVALCAIYGCLLKIKVKLVSGKMYPVYLLKKVPRTILRVIGLFRLYRPQKV
jgi:hypothetical protein